MTLDPQKMLELMAYADGELDEAEARAVEAWMATDPEAANVVENVARLGQYVVSGHETRTASFDVADAVMARLDEAPVEKASGASVTVLDTARRERRSDASTRLRIGFGLVATLSLAAAAILVLRPKEQSMALAPVSAVTQPASEDVSGGVEVTAIDVPGQSVSVFYLPSANNVSTNVVVWVDETVGR